MVGLKACWRQVGGLVAVCLMFIVLAVPTLDAVVCQGDAHRLPTASAEGQTVVSVELERACTEHGLPSSCPHGHCHHGAGFPLAATEGAASRIQPAVPHALVALAQRDSLSPAGLERPPRA